MKKIITAISIVAALVVPVTASASDADLTRLGVKATATTQAYLACGAGRTVVCVRRVTAFVNADTAAIKYLTREINAGRVQPGSACWRANLAISTTPSRRQPWTVAQRWLFSGASKADVIDAQIAFLRQLLKVRTAC